MIKKVERGVKVWEDKGVGGVEEEKEPATTYKLYTESSKACMYIYVNT